VSVIGSMALVLVAYGLGSVPFSFLVARLFGVADVRRVGSGNVGATNVLRTAGPSAGILAFLLDAAKGAIAVLVVRTIGGEGWVPAASAVAAVVGHMYPVWLRFEGGKGVATGFGAFLPLAPLAALGAVGAFGVVAAASRLVSLGSMVGAATLFGAAAVLGAPVPVIAGSGCVAALVLLRHRSNILRIVRGALGRSEEKGGA
jgi:acyl phosphate:glycerol-3-phosphate acyltransferase